MSASLAGLTSLSTKLQFVKWAIKVNHLNNLLPSSCVLTSPSVQAHLPTLHALIFRVLYHNPEDVFFLASLVWRHLLRLPTPRFSHPIQASNTNLLYGHVD
ncbi:unnamed protein product [Protopolystoma xenopodis]|uniref:Uncharacterized protein n=1 Tax=Protopolystoma xenopodis TaxID=117903 RepID=A0A3S4ZRA7_9PLAT|nr:unnamed protein product [Protopolystoma xenopodis]